MGRQIGYVRGVATGRELRGEWYEAMPSTSLGRGNFTMTMSADGSYFTGSWGYGSSMSDGGSWSEPRLSYTRPSDMSCFATTGSVAGACVVGWSQSTCGCVRVLWSMTGSGVRLLGRGQCM